MNILKRNHVQVHGEHGPTLLYAHGFGCNQTLWNRVTPAFAGSHRQVLFDYVGSGRADPRAFDPLRYNQLGAYVQDLIEVCDALGLRGVTLVAHSVSCSIGLLASIRRPELFDRMLLLGPSPCFLNHPPDYAGGFERDDLDGLLALMDQNYIGWARQLAPMAAGAAGLGGGAEVAEELSDSFCSTDPLMARAFAQATFLADNRADLPQVVCPSLILQHRHDALAPLSVGEYLHARLPNSRMTVLDVAGHCGHLSHPMLVIEALRGYLALRPAAEPVPA